MKNVLQKYTVFLFSIIIFTVLPIEKINNNVYVEKKDDLYFVLERLSQSNKAFWNEYVKQQQKTARQKKLLNPIPAMLPFREFITYYDKENNNDHIWIAYATSKTITDESVKIPLKLEGDIEMVVTVTTDADIPFSTHMGIFRAVDFEPRHKNLSMDLHSFAAKAITTIYKNKDYMITKPVEIMETIFKKALPKDSLWKNDAKKTISQSKENTLTITTKSEEEKTFQKPYFFAKSPIFKDISELTIIDLDALAHYPNYLKEEETITDTKSIDTFTQALNNITS